MHAMTMNFGSPMPQPRRIKSTSDKADAAFGYFSKKLGTLQKLNKTSNGKGRSPTLLQTRTLGRALAKNISISRDSSVTDSKGNESDDSDGSTGSVRNLSPSVSDRLSRNSAYNSPQTEKKSFSTDLWDRFDNVAQEVSDCRHDVKTALLLFEGLAAAQNQFSQSLKKIEVASEDFRITASSVVHPYNQLRVTIRSLSSFHEQMATTLTHKVCSKLSSLIDDLKGEIVSKKSKHKALQKELSNLQATYEKRVKQYKKSLNQARTATLNLKSHRRQGKSLSKIEKETDSRKKDLRSRVSDLEKSVVNLATHQERTYDADAVMLSEFEQLQRKRVTELLQTFTKTNQMTKVLAEGMLTHAAKEATALSRVDADKDILATIQRFETFQKKPLIVTIRKGKDGLPLLGDPEDQDSAPNSAAGSYADGSVVNPLEMYEDKNDEVYDENYVVALHDYTDDIHDEKDSKKDSKLPSGPFSFKTGDRIEVLEKTNDSWWKGKVDLREGYFPALYTRPLGSEKPRPIMLNQFHQAMWDFEPSSSDELRLKADEILFVTAAVSRWCVGVKIPIPTGEISLHSDLNLSSSQVRKAIENEPVGIFPAEFVRPLEVVKIVNDG